MALEGGSEELMGNFNRLWGLFSDESFLGQLPAAVLRRKEEYKACVYGLCYYHRWVGR